MTEQPVWTETDSRDFLHRAEIAVPAREEETRALLDLISSERAGSSLVKSCWMQAGHAVCEGYR